MWRGLARSTGVHTSLPLLAPGTNRDALLLCQGLCLNEFFVLQGKRAVLGHGVGLAPLLVYQACRRWWVASEPRTARTTKSIPERQPRAFFTSRISSGRRSGWFATASRLKEWAGQRSGPILMYNNERPRAGWAEILLLSERLAPNPSLLPKDAVDRALVFGLAHEICGEQGLAWSRRSR
jgi:hypothetical protein